MQALTIIQGLFAYTADFDQRIWQSIEGLTDEQFCADYAYARGSLRNQLVHVASAERVWLSGLQNGQRPPHLDPLEYSTIERVRTLHNDVRSQLMGYVNQLSEEQLAEVLPTMNLALWQVLVHLTNHATEHRAQILRLLHDYGQNTFDQDIVLHFWGR